MSHHLSGLTAWLVQRLSAIYMALFLVICVFSLTPLPALHYAQWYQFFSNPLVAIALPIFFLALLLHVWVGVRDVILDYAGQTPLIRLALLAMLGFWLIAMGVWLIRIMIKVML